MAPHLVRKERKANITLYFIILTLPERALKLQANRSTGFGVILFFFFFFFFFPIVSCCAQIAEQNYKVIILY